MPRFPAPQHYIGYEVTGVNGKEITLSNKAKLRSNSDDDFPADVKGSPLMAVATSGDGITLVFENDTTVDCGEFLTISDPEYPESPFDYIPSVIFDPQTPPEPDRPEPDE